MPLSDSGDPGNIHEAMGLGPQRPDLLTEATWNHIHERYQLCGELGRGGQAVVFEAKERAAPHRRVALKVYHESTDAAGKAFRNECRILASDHLPPEVVDYYQCVDEPNLQPYLVLEFIDGRKLADLAIDCELTFDRKLKLIERLARSFHRLHDSNLVFGDASANNILIEKDFVIRFVDLAGAKERVQGHGRSRSSINLVTPDFVPQGADRTSLCTDIYALAANSFYLCIGRTASNSSNGAPQNGETDPNRALAEAGVPAGLCRIILKGLRIPDETVTDDPRLYSSAEDFAIAIESWRRSRERRRTLLRHSLVALVLILAVGAIGAIGWQKYWIADALADLKIWQSLQAEERVLPNLNHPAVAKLVDDEKELVAQRDACVARGDQAGARQVLGQLLTKSRDVLRVAREVDKATTLREAIGKVLLEDEAGEKAGFWIASAPMIDRRLDELRRRYVAVAKQIQNGETESLSENLARLQVDLGELFRVNIEARSAFDARIGYERLKGQAPERLLTHDGFRTIDAGAKSADKSWAVTAWDRGQSLALARLQFGAAQQQLAEWLPKNMNAAELASFEKGNRERVVQLETERLKLQADYDRKTEDIRKINEQITKLTQERLDDQQRLATATASLKDEKTLRHAAESKVADFDKVQTALAKAQNDLKGEKTKIAELSGRLTTTELNLATARSEVKREQDRADAAEKQNKQLAAVAESGGADAARRAREITELNSTIAAVGIGNLEQAEKAFAATVQRYGNVQAERKQLLESYKSDAPRVTAKDKELTIAEQQMEAALAKVDSAHRAAFEEFGSRIASQQTKMKGLTEIDGLLDTAAAVVAVRTAIDQLKQQQQPHVAGAARAAGNGTKLTVEKMLALAGTVTVGGLEFVSKSTGMKLVRIPAGTFQMGSPDTETQRSSDEGPVHSVRISQFYMGVYEVPQGVYQKVMGRNPSHFKSVSGKDTTQFPVDSVGWYDAIEFCNTLSEADGFTPRYRRDSDQKIKSAKVELIGGTGYRLPTEAEWEYAGRAGTGTPFHFGSTLNGDKANVDGKNPYGTTTTGDYLKRTSTVGSYSPNKFGLYDMHGNVMEWCFDVYDSAAYKSRSGTTVDPLVTAGSEYRVLRGGSWSALPGARALPIASGFSPGSRNSNIGFRVVR